MGEYEAAIKDYSTAMQMTNDKLSLFNHRAYCYAKIGCFAEAIGDYNSVLEIDPGNAHALYNRAFSLDKLGISAEDEAEEAGRR